MTCSSPDPKVKIRIINSNRRGCRLYANAIDIFRPHMQSLELGDRSGDHVSSRSSQQRCLSQVLEVKQQWEQCLLLHTPCFCYLTLCVSDILPVSSSLFLLLTSKSGTYGTVPNVSERSCKRDIFAPQQPNHIAIKMKNSVGCFWSGHQARWVQVMPLLLPGVCPSHQERVRSPRLLSTHPAPFCMLLLEMPCVCGTSASKSKYRVTTVQNV